jgi:hypothetical protein
MRSLLLLALISTAACTAEVHATTPPPPEVHAQVVVRTPPPTATVVVETTPPPPPTTTVVVQTPPPPPPATFTVVTEPTVTVVQMHYSVADGRPAGLHPGAPEALWIWHDDRGRFWHVRTTTHSQRHRFSGAVLSDGAITNMNATDHSFADRIRADAKSVNFDFFTQGHEDGFDFRVVGSQCVRFYMTVDGRSEPQLVHIGRANAHPTGWHFKLCP